MIRLDPAEKENSRTPTEGSPFAKNSRVFRVWTERQQVTVMEELFATLHAEIELRTKLEQELDEMRASLKDAGDALARTQAREVHARHLATHDELTSLSNRSYFSERLHTALIETEQSGASLAVVYLDLDDFKALNDGYGHEAGDDLLRITAARLSRVVRSEDVLSRLGGDEFACLLTGSLNRDQLGRFALKLYDAVSATCQIGKLSLTVRPSIGIAVCPDDAIAAEGLLRKADAAMYSAKRSKSRFAFCLPDL
jgi:diguanylate cyclase (GGDEF)-like protein